MGVCSVIRPLPVDQVILKRDIPVSIGVTVLLLLMTGAGALFNGKLLQFEMNEIARRGGRFDGVCVTSSGNDVPTATIVSPIKVSDIPKAFATVLAPCTTACPPPIIKVKPDKISTTHFQRGIFSPDSSSPALFFASTIR